MTILDWLKNTGGKTIGLLEMVGLKYPVKTYVAQVSPTLWRGSRLPNDAAYLDLKNKGFSLIVNLCAENDMDAKPAEKYGLKHARIPIIDNTAPTEEQMFKFLKLATDPTQLPLFVHCEKGLGRTGTVVACYRLAVCHWTLQQVLDESAQYGQLLECQESFLAEFSTNGVAKWLTIGSAQTTS